MTSTSVSRSPDRRQRKSRAALQEALLTLIATKPYDAITIEDVTDTADVARATFYAHYKDKTALLGEASQALIRELTERLPAIAAPEWPVYTGAAIFEVFRHADEHADLYRLIISGRGGAAARDEFIAALEGAGRVVFATLAGRAGQAPRIPLDVTTRAFVGAALLTLEFWLADIPRVDYEEIALQFLTGQVGGLEWCLGFEPGEGRLERAARTSGPADEPR